MKTTSIFLTAALAALHFSAFAQQAIPVTAASNLAPPLRVVPALEPGKSSAPALCKPEPSNACAQKPVKRTAKPKARAPVVTERMPTEKVDAVPETKPDTNMGRAATLAKDWNTAENRATVGEDGRVLFTYGAGLPVVVCAPLRICVIELQAGERVNKEVQLGDSVRWIVAPAESGAGKTAQTLVVIKPKEVGLDTNLLIPTDRRNYYIRLVSRPTEYVARVAFSYPDEARAAWETYAAKKAELARNEVAPDMAAMSIERLAFNYSIEGDSAFRPIRVLDNGEKTYIQLPANAKAEEIPVLVILNTEGKEQLVNSRFINGWFEVDRLFERAALILGVGNDQKKVLITNTARFKPRYFWNFGGN